jgi:hypothetical protein
MALPSDSWRTGIETPGPARSEPATTFDVGGQSGGTINNIGGSQNVFLPGKAIVLPDTSARLTPLERATAVAGLLLFWAGIVVAAYLVKNAVTSIVDDVNGDGLRAYTTYVSPYWSTALGLILLGIVVPRLGLRLFGRSAGPG